MSDEQKLVEWFLSRDTGASSKAIAGFLSTGVKSDDVPHDSGDFGRCYRLLLHMGWQDRIAEMAAVSGRWAVLVEIWDQITAAYEREDHKEVYRLIGSVEAEGYERDGYEVMRGEGGRIRSASKKGGRSTINLGNGIAMSFGA